MKSMLADASTIGGWRRSSRCDNSGPNCLEVTGHAGGVAVRDSKSPTGPALLFSTDEWDAFLDGAKAGEFDEAAKLV